MAEVFINGPINQFDDFIPPFVTDVNGSTVTKLNQTWIDKTTLISGWSGIVTDASGNITYVHLNGSDSQRPYGSNFDNYDSGLEGYYYASGLKYLGALFFGTDAKSQPSITRKFFYNQDSREFRVFFSPNSPSSTDDVTKGYRIGDRWLDTTLHVELICYDATQGAASWSGSGAFVEIDPTALKMVNNLSDLTDTAAARNNIGLGSSSTPTFAGANIGAVSNTELQYLDGVTSPIQTQLNNLGSTYVRSTRFAIISSGTSGTVTLPTASTVVLDDFGGTVDAVITLTSGGRPVFDHARDSSGNIISTTFDSLGNYVLSGTPVSYPVAIVYRVRQTNLNFVGTDSSIIGDYNPDSTKPKSGIISGGSFSGSPKKYSVVFTTPFIDTKYSIEINSGANRLWSYESKTANGFTINANANTAFIEEVSWFATQIGESI
jgi:hypothetical protein